MMKIEVVDVLARDDVDLLVPLAIEGGEGCQLLPLRLGQCRKIFLNQFHVCKNNDFLSTRQDFASLFLRLTEIMLSLQRQPIP